MKKVSLSVVGMERLLLLILLSDLLVFAVFLRAVYLEALRPGYVFWVVIVMMPITLMLISKIGSEGSFLLALYAVSVVLTLWLYIRFNGNFGTDIVAEMYTAEYALRHGFLATLKEKFYGLSFQMSITPSILNFVCRFDIHMIFNIYWVFSAMSPIVLYMVLKEKCGYELASLTSVVYIFDYVIMSTLPQITKLGLSSTLFFLFILMVTQSLKDNPYKKEPIIVMCVLMVGIIITHYFLAWFSVLIFLVIVCTSLFRMLLKDGSNHVTLYGGVFCSIFLFSLFCLLTWNMYFFNPIFKRVINISWLSFHTLLKGVPVIFLETSNPFMAIRGNEIVKFVTFVYRAFIVLGFFTTLKNSHKLKELEFTIWGGLWLLVTYIWMISTLQYSVGINQIYVLGMFPFAFFIASIILALPMIKSHNFILSTFLITMFFLQSVMVLPPIYYTPVQDIKLEDQLVAPLISEHILALRDYVVYHACDPLKIIVDRPLYRNLDSTWTASSFNESNIKGIREKTLISILATNRTSNEEYFVVNRYIWSGYLVGNWNDILKFGPMINHTLYSHGIAIFELNKNKVRSFLERHEIIYDGGQFQIFSGDI